MDDRLFSQTIGLFKEFKEVDAIVLGGSRASGRHDPDSDYDVYVYLSGDLSAETRRTALSQTCGYMEINNTYWEAEDDCVLNNGIPFEVIYRSIEDTRQSLRNTLEKHIAWCGYTTCICHNVFSSKILHDPKGLYGGMVERFSMPYPEPLRQNIISKNRELLDGKMPSYSGQIQKAVKRGDAVGVNHRLAEFLSSYFDILFALNRVFH
ncbi:MAG: nucleotidyltransferase domain-containing protein, partial [Oscillospiraceae bacterium]|nr:nucleotidyltransferase domain-containing protein [Oscillospiraceae bacterium]